MDQHFYNALSQVDLLDENDQLNYKDILIKQTRDLYKRQQERDINKQRIANMRKQGDESYLEQEEQLLFEEKND